MRILWVKADKLLPVQNGGNIRTYHVLRYLSARHELTFYSYYGGTPDPYYDRDLQQQLLVILSELEHRELGHDGAVFFATESGGGVAAL